MAQKTLFSIYQSAESGAVVVVVCSSASAVHLYRADIKLQSV